MTFFSKLKTVYKRKKESQRATQVITRLQEEMSVQKQHVQMLRNHLAEEKDRWFQSASKVFPLLSLAQRKK